MMGRDNSAPTTGQGLYIIGGICALLWPILSLSFYAAYPIAAGGTMRTLTGGPGAYAIRLAELGQRSAVIALEWFQTALPLLLLPFLLATYKLLTQRGQADLAWVAVSLGLMSMILALPSGAINATLSHSLGQSYVKAIADAERAAIVATLRGVLTWHRGLNQISSLLYQAFVGLISAGLLLVRKWRTLGWLGIVGALLSLIAKLTPGLPGVTNLLWTGIAYVIWPIALGIGLLRTRNLTNTAPSL